MWFLPGIGGILWKNPAGQYANIASDTFIKTDDPKENNPVVRQESHRGEPSYSDLLNRTTRQHTFWPDRFLTLWWGPFRSLIWKSFTFHMGRCFVQLPGLISFI